MTRARDFQGKRTGIKSRILGFFGEFWGSCICYLSAPMFLLHRRSGRELYERVAGVEMPCALSRVLESDGMLYCTVRQVQYLLTPHRRPVRHAPTHGASRATCEIELRGDRWSCARRPPYIRGERTVR